MKISADRGKAFYARGKRRITLADFGIVNAEYSIGRLVWLLGFETWDTFMDAWRALDRIQKALDAE